MALKTRGQSETIGVVLLTGVVVIVAVVAGGVMVTNVTSQTDSTPLLDVKVNATTQDVTVDHTGGDSLNTDNVDIILRGSSTVRYPLSSFTQVTGSDGTRFAPGDKWRRIHDIDGERMEVLIVHKPSNSIVDSETVPITVTIAARFSYSPDNPTPTDTVTFDASDSTVKDSTITSYEWDFDNNGRTDETGETVDYSFPEDGEYPVTLTMTADDGRVTNRTKTVIVYNEYPRASFTYSPSNPDTGETISFIGSGSNDLDGTITDYEWDFGDGNTSSGETTTHNYSSDGSYTVQLDVTDDDGTTRRTSEIVSVGNANPPFTNTAVTSLVPNADGQRQTVQVTVGTNLSSGETVTVNLTEAQSVSPEQVDYSSAGVTLINGSGGSSPQFVTQNATNAKIRYYAPSGGLSAGGSVTLRIDSIAVGPPSSQDNPYSVSFDRSDGGSTSDSFSVAYNNGDSGLLDVSTTDMGTGLSQSQTISFTLGTKLDSGQQVVVDLSDAQSTSVPFVDYQNANGATVINGTGSASLNANAKDAHIIYTAGSDDGPNSIITVDVDGQNARNGSPTRNQTYTSGFSREDADTQSSNFDVISPFVELKTEVASTQSTGKNGTVEAEDVDFTYTLTETGAQSANEVIVKTTDANDNVETETGAATTTQQTVVTSFNGNNKGKFPLTIETTVNGACFNAIITDSNDVANASQDDWSACN